jgi:putative addiction module component (TIGR02574 family)
MSPNLKECESQALKLSVDERATLAEHLIESLDNLYDTEIENLWLEEAERRYQAHRQGQVSSKPAAEAIRDARALIN